MKIAISLPADLSHRADRLATEQGKTRSRVFVEAMTAWLAARDQAAITAALDSVESQCADGDEIAAWTAANQARLAETEW